MSGKEKKHEDTIKKTNRSLHLPTTMKLWSAVMFRIQKLLRIYLGYVFRPLLNICRGHALAQQMEPDVVDWLGCVAIKWTTIQQMSDVWAVVMSANQSFYPTFWWMHCPMCGKHLGCNLAEETSAKKGSHAEIGFKINVIRQWYLKSMTWTRLASNDHYFLSSPWTWHECMFMLSAQFCSFLFCKQNRSFHATKIFQEGH